MLGHTLPQRDEEPPLTICRRIRTLAAAAMLALTVVSASAGHVHAEPKGPDTGVRCSLPGGPTIYSEDFVFFVPGDTVSVTTNTGRIVVLKCGADGNWIVLGISPPSAGVRPVGPRPMVLAP